MGRSRGLSSRLDVAKARVAASSAVLRAAARPSIHEVINASVPGYSTFQQAAYLELHGDDLHPDLVVLQFCLNDVVERYQALAEYGGESMFLGVDTRAGVSGMYGVLLRNSRAFERIARLVQRVGRRRAEYEVRDLAQDELAPEYEKAWRRTLGEIDAIREWTDAREVPLLLVITPYRFQLENPDDLRQPQDLLVEYGRAHGIAVIDLLPEFARIADGASLYEDENHFSPIGHEMTARVLLPAVRDVLSTGRGRVSGSEGGP